MFKNTHFEDFLKEEHIKNKSEVFSFEYEGEKYWLKRARKTSSNIFHKIVYKLFSFDILVPVEKKTKKESIFFETNKIELLSKEGIPIPQLVYKHDDFFVMKDTGKAIYSFLKSKNSSLEDYYLYLEKSIDLIAKIHNKGFYHGGAQIRNFTYKDEIISAIDFEDSFDENIDVKVLQKRDLLLFLLSLTKIIRNYTDYSYIVNGYLNKTQNYEFLDYFKKLAK